MCTSVFKAQPCGGLVGASCAALRFGVEGLSSCRIGRAPSERHVLGGTWRYLAVLGGTWRYLVVLGGTWRVRDHCVQVYLPGDVVCGSAMPSEVSDRPKQNVVGLFVWVPNPVSIRSHQSRNANGSDRQGDNRSAVPRCRGGRRQLARRQRPTGARRTVMLHLACSAQCCTRHAT